MQTYTPVKRLCLEGTRTHEARLCNLLFSHGSAPVEIRSIPLIAGRLRRCMKAIEIALKHLHEQIL